MVVRIEVTEEDAVDAKYLLKYECILRTGAGSSGGWDWCDLFSFLNRPEERLCPSLAGAEDSRLMKASGGSSKYIFPMMMHSLMLLCCDRVNQVSYIPILIVKGMSLSKHVLLKLY